MELTVTQDDIDQGKSTESMLCPIALAFARMGFDTSITRRFVRFFGSGDILIPLPKVAYNFVVAFDAGKTVKPFTFTLRLIN